MPDETTPRSRRALLAAAAGGAAALAAQAALPLNALAADPNDVVLGAANHATSTTGIFRDDDTPSSVAVTISNGGGLGGVGTESIGHGVGVHANGYTLAGTYSVSRVDLDNVPAPFSETAYTGVYGYSAADPVNGLGTGIWGDSPDFGVFGTGFFGVYGSGVVGVTGQAETTSQPGVKAFGATTSSPALEVVGKVRFNRAGRKSIPAGASSAVVTMAGVSTTSRIIAVLNSNRASRYVRAVVPSTGKFTIYLNATVSSSSYVAYVVFD